MIATRRLLAAGVVSTSCLLLVAPPAWADATLILEEPAADERGKRRFVEATDGKVVLAGEVSSEDGRIESVDFTFEPALSASPIEACRTEPEKTVEVQADETALFELVLDARCNRKHTLKATVIHKAPLDLALVTPPPTDTEAVEFGVAIPPVRVKGFGAKYNADTKGVVLSWQPNSEPDLIGYRLERSGPGASDFTSVTDEPLTGTEFTDPGIEEEHVYRVAAVRSGPDGPISGPVSAVVRVGPDKPAPIPELLPDRGEGAAGGGSSGSRTGSGAATSRRRTLTTADDGFSKNLPFDPSRTTTVPAPSSSIEPPADAAVLAEFDDDPVDADDRRGTLVPVAGGLALLVGAAHMALLSKRAAEPDIPMVPR